MPVCRSCSAEFDRPKTPGRPPVRCNPCRGLKSAPVVTDTLIADPLKVSLKYVAKKYFVSDFVALMDRSPEIIYMSPQEIARAIRSL